MSFFFFPGHFPFPVIIGLIVWIAISKTAKSSRRYLRETEQRLCRGCGTSHPTFADFCRRCGRKL